MGKKKRRHDNPVRYVDNSREAIDAALCAKISRLTYSEGKTVEETARILGCSQPFVRGHLERLRSRWIAMANGEYAETLGRRLAQMEEIRLEAMRGWELSKRPRQSIKKKREPQEAISSPAIDGSSISDVIPFDIFADISDPVVEPEPVTMVVTEEVREKQQSCGDVRYLQMAKDCIDTQLQILGAFKNDLHVIGGMITIDQMKVFADTVMRGVGRVVQDEDTVQLVKQKVLEMLPSDVMNDVGRNGDGEREEPRI